MVLDGTGSVYDDTGWYLVSISWYCLVLGGTASAKGLYACIYWKRWRFGRVLSIPNSQTTEYRATQLVSSITHKLSHAINKSNSFWDTLLGGYMGLYLCVFFVPIVSLLKRRRWWCSPPQSAQPLRKPLADEEELMRASGFIYFICSIVHLYLYLYLFCICVCKLG